MFHEILELVIVAFLHSFDIFGLVLEFNIVIRLHLLDSLFLVLLQALKLHIIVLLLGLGQDMGLLNENLGKNTLTAPCIRNSNIKQITGSK